MLLLILTRMRAMPKYFKLNKCGYKPCAKSLVVAHSLDALHNVLQRIVGKAALPNFVDGLEAAWLDC